MKQKHTPAPWVVGMGGSIRCGYTDKDGDDIIIGGVKNRSIQIGSAPFTTVGHKESIANAHLIAAAPELLEALEKLNDITKYHPQVCDIARTAIKKAKGE